LNSKFKKIVGVIALFFLVIAAVVYFKFFSSNTNFQEEEVYVYIPTNASYEQVKKIITPYVKNINGFDNMASLRSYPDNVKSGKFLLKNGMGNFQLIRALRQNTPVQLAFNNQERLENFVQRVSSQLEPDSLKLMSVITNEDFLSKNGFTKENVIGMFMPNTYEFYWNTSAEKFRDKMLEEYKKFWTEERLNKAKQLNMTPMEVATLASIVHKESIHKSERPTIARAYLNRIKIGMALQADPTVVYAKKIADNDFNQVIKRVGGTMLSIDSPYNTYKYSGLPPGPIAMPDINAIDAVLNPEDNNYIYFCASVDRIGYHEFSTTYSEHQMNANKYTKKQNEKGNKLTK
jgi:UPF0755 protein